MYSTKKYNYLVEGKKRKRSNAGKTWGETIVLSLKSEMIL